MLHTNGTHEYVATHMDVAREEVMSQVNFMSLIKFMSHKNKTCHTSTHDAADAPNQSV